jgi:hypothetical protein
MDVQSAAAPAASAPVTPRLEIRAGHGGRAQPGRMPFSDLEIAPSQSLPTILEPQLGALSNKKA